MDIAPTGYPDTNVGGSVVQVIKYSAQINAPASTGTANWDAHFFNLPHTLPIDYSVYTLQSGSNNISIPSGLSTLPLGGVVGFTGASGSDLSLRQGIANQLGSTTPVSVTLPLEINTTADMGPFRIVGMGFEVVNTTADLYLQGLCTAYRQPQGQPWMPTYLISNADVSGGSPYAYGTYANCYYTQEAPNSLANALLLRGSRQWEAREGSYSVVTYNGIENPASTPLPICSVVSGTPVSGGSRGAIGGLSFTTASYINQLTDRCNWNTSGVYFTGLSPQTTLTLNVVYYVERFPNPFDSNLVVLTRAPCGYDPMALELYARALCEMPPGVMRKENGLGDWFKKVVSNIAPLARGIGSTLKYIPHPIAQAGSALANAVGDLAPGKTFTTDTVQGTQVTKRNNNNRTKSTIPRSELIAASNDLVPSKIGKPLTDKAAKRLRRLLATLAETGRVE